MTQETKNKLREFSIFDPDLIDCTKDCNESSLVRNEEYQALCGNLSAHNLDDIYPLPRFSTPEELRICIKYGKRSIPLITKKS